MSRRRLVALVSATVILVFVTIVVGAVLMITQTGFGRERIRRLALGEVSSGLRGRGALYIGRISGSMFTEVVIDSVSLRDAEDSLFVATGPIRVTFDPRDLLDQRLHFRTVEITRANVYLRRHANDVWNYRTIFPGGPKGPRRVTLGWGDFIVADTVVLRDAAFTLTESWSPDDSLRGARRDSAVRVALARAMPEIRMTKEGPKRTHRWTHLDLRAPGVIIASPQSPGQTIAIASMGVTESDPPTVASQLHGSVRIRADSVWVALTHFDLPGTTGRATAKIVSGGGKPARLDIRAVADSVSLRDFAWVYAHLPRVGGGRSEVYVRNDPRNLRSLEIALKNLDLRTARSHLRGNMTFATNWPVFVMKDVALSLEPVDFDLLRAFSDGPLPIDWQGQFTGRVDAAGGRIDAWRVDSADLTLRDGHVPGAVSRIKGHGEIDLLDPSFARFHAFAVQVAPLDLRTIEFLFPTFPRLRGTVTGSATLDSIWTDVRFREADLSFRDGPGAPSRVAGAGRITSSGPAMVFDVALDAQPLAFTTLARSYPGFPLRGEMSGPLRVQGTTNRLTLAGRLAGAAGMIAMDEVIDIDTAGGVGARGSVRAQALDVAALLADSALPTTRLYASAMSDVHGDSLATMRGGIALTVDTSWVAEIWVPRATARTTLADGHLSVDSLLLASTGLRVRASGRLGLAVHARDTLSFAATVDSLGGLRSLFRGSTSRPADSGSAGRAPTERDSLVGKLTLTGVLAGSVADSFSARGTFDGERLLYAGIRATRLAGAFDLAGFPRRPHGTVRAVADSAEVLGAGLDTVAADLEVTGAHSGVLALGASSARSAGAMRGGARLAYGYAGDTLSITLDTLAVAANDHRWRLLAPTHARHSPAGDWLDSLRLRSGGAMVAASADLPMAGDVRAYLRADSVPLADLGAIVQSTRPMGGSFTGEFHLSGSRAAPVMQLVSRLRAASYGVFALPYLTFNADYAARRLAARLDIFDRGQAAASASLTLPADLALLSVPTRWLDEPLTGRIRADSVDLGILSSMTAVVSDPKGTAAADITLSGTHRQPLFSGRMSLRDGEVGLPRFGVRLSALTADLRFSPEGVRIATLTAQSGKVPGNFLSLAGTLRAPDLLALWDDRHALSLDLEMRARSFQLVDSRRYARIEITDSVALRGSLTALVLSGRIAVDKADFYLSDLARKGTVVDLDDPELFQDPAVAASRQQSATLPPDIAEALRNLRVDNLDVTIGDKVWLRSAESEIKLGGAVQITGSGSQRLTGRIDVQRGAYRLDLGLVQRTFQVDSGNVAFYGDAEKLGRLDIWASSTVRQANRLGEDVRILAHITGTTDRPHAEFSSGERYALSETEILSYLIFGQPSLYTGSNAVAQALLPSLGTVMERALTSQVRWVDQITIQPGSSTSQQAEQTSQNAALYGSRFGFGKQIGERTYVSANAGLCWLSATATSVNSFSQSLGVSVEHRISEQFFLMASMEPSSAALLCKPSSTDIGSHPKQYGFDLFREWSF